MKSTFGKDDKKLVFLEGNTQKLDGGAMFGNAPKALWQNWIPADDRNRISLSCRCLLIDDPHNKELVLIEAGVGCFFDPHLKDRYGVQEESHCLLMNLAKAGYDPQNVTRVYLTHLHFDHAGGILSSYHPQKPAELVFKNAAYFVSATNWERAQNPHFRDRASFVPQLNELLKTSGRLYLVNSTDSAVSFYSKDNVKIEHTKQMMHPTWLKFHFCDGHTPGLMLPEVSTPQGPLLFASDLIPGAPWVHLPITMGYDRFPEKLIEEKHLILKDLVSRGGSLFFTHDPHVPSGKVICDDSGKFRILTEEKAL